MDLRDYFETVASTYDRHALMSAPTQLLLRAANRELAQHAPGGIEVVGSGGKGVPTLSPWIGFFDPDETTTPEIGVYVVYLFADGLGSLTLSLNQGMTKLSNQLGNTTARVKLAADAEAIRGELGSIALAGLSPTLTLGTRGFRQLAYEAGNIAAIRYDTASLPSEDELRADLARLLSLYQDAIVAKRRLLQSSPGAIATASVQQVEGGDDPLQDFCPKNDADYVAHIQGRIMLKSRRHETLVRQFGEWARAQGFVCSTRDHPVDLVLQRDGQAWLIEAEVVRQGRATSAVREAVGQLLEYQYFKVSKLPYPKMIALFSEPIGEAFARYLDGLGIGSVWKDSGNWCWAAGDASSISRWT